MISEGLPDDSGGKIYEMTQTPQGDIGHARKTATFDLTDQVKNGMLEERCKSL